MRLGRRGLVVVLLVLATTAPGPSAEARAGACTGVGVLTTGAMSLDPARPLLTGFAMTFGTGGCVPGSSFAATGTIAGSCSLAVGHGITNEGESFVFRAVAGSIVFSGEVLGQLTWTEDPTDAASCLSNNATDFLIGGTLVLAAAGTVRARECVGAGTMTTSVGLSSDVTSTVTTPFWMTFGIGHCAVAGTFAATGTLTGGCTSAQGSGTTSEGESFDFTVVPGAIVFTGDAVGLVTWTEDPLNGGSCQAGNERGFLIRGAVALVQS